MKGACVYSHLDENNQLKVKLRIEMQIAKTSSKGTARETPQ